MLEIIAILLIVVVVLLMSIWKELKRANTTTTMNYYAPVTVTQDSWSSGEPQAQTTA